MHFLILFHCMQMRNAIMSVISFAKLIIDNIDLVNMLTRKVLQPNNNDNLTP
jgi:hypothetical protein